MAGPKVKKKLKKSIHDIKDYKAFLETLQGQGLKGLGKYFKRKLTPVPKRVKNRRKLIASLKKNKKG
jgi:hypothetical protein|tara:strand:- start:413 stop:613 length:201 start_codon:yes stop_codon:yes gene_type:complete